MATAADEPAVDPDAADDGQEPPEEDGPKRGRKRQRTGRGRGARAWSIEELEAARLQGDDEADRLVREVLGPGGTYAGIGRLGYNRLLDLADVLIEAPELAFAGGEDEASRSNVRRALAKLPPELRDWFDPVPLPDWVDEARLARASALWEENTLAIIGVLYGLSLPACYLVADGIPALYRTGKLVRHDYLQQRIYETGVFLDAVLSRGGLRVSRDAVGEQELCASLEEANPGSGWAIEDGAAVCLEGTPKRPDEKRLAQRLDARRRRYLWGAGVVAARKVRFLHASMRFMLQHPERFRGPGGARPATLSEGLAACEGWDVDEHGVPVNQEDLAYTLLTFGYCIPVGLGRWGVKLDRQQREDFLHLWRLVGHLMGIRDDLLPASWTDAERLFATIRDHQAAESRTGQQMAESLMRFLEDYLPRWKGVHRSLSAKLIVDHLALIGDDYDEMLLTEHRRAAAANPWLRLAFVPARLCLSWYFRVRGFVFKRFPLIRAAWSGAFHEAAESLIASWRDAFRRRPFYVPRDAQTWERQRGVDREHLEQLRGWRKRLFTALAIAIACFVPAAGMALIGLVGWPWSTTWFVTWLFLAAVAGGVGLYFLRWRVAAIARRRPVAVRVEV